MERRDSDRGRWRELLACLAVGLGLTVLLAWGTVDAPLVSEDASAVVYTDRFGPLADFTGPQYDLRTVRFWRPLVTFSIGVQTALTGADASGLRLFNLACHGLGAALCGAIVLALGGGRLGALMATAWATTFPFAGGTAHWVVGRVDSQCVPMVLACVWACLRGHARLAGLCAFLALATKESGGVAAAAATVMLWGRDGSVRSALFHARWAWLGLGLAVVCRRAALGMWVGGYAVEGAASGSGLSGLGAGLASAGRALTPALWVVPIAFALAAVGLRSRLRLALATTLVALGSLVPLAPLLGNGELELVHRRWLLGPDAWIGVSLGTLMLATGGKARWAVGLITASTLAATVSRGLEARADFQRWASAGRTAGAVELAVRGAVTNEAVSDRPLLIATASRLTEDEAAYVLQWGVADRFRPPFDVTPRPIWPWRPLFNALERDRSPASIPSNGLRRPFDEGRAMVPELPIAVLDRGVELGRTDAIVLDERVLVDGELTDVPALVIEGDVPAARFEWMLFTELGFGTALWSEPGPAYPLPVGIDLARPPVEPVRIVPLRAALLASNDAALPLYASLRQAADFGAEVAYLQLRAVDDARGKVDRPVAASRWIRVEWGDELRRTMLPLARPE